MAGHMEQIYENTYVIREVGCAGEVNMYLIVGEKRAALIDCGYGGLDIPAMIRTVTDLPVTVICTHGHIDHAFGSWMFEDVYLHPMDMEVYKEHGNRQMQEESWSRADLRMLKFYKLSEEEFAKQRERALSHEMGAVKTLEDGQRFDLGGRTLSVVHMPGHTAGSVLVEDVEYKVLFSGDNLNSQVWMCLRESVPLKEYKNQLSRVRQFVTEKGIGIHYPGHGRKADDCVRRIDKLLKCTEKALSRKNHGKMADRGFTKGYVARCGFTAVLYKK